MNSELETRSPPPITRSILNPVLNEPDSPFDLALRPAGFDEFHGQTKVKDQLMVMVEAAKLRNEPLDHVLLCGPPGLGKTTLANLIANAMGTKLHTTSGPQIERAGDLAGILTNMGERDLMFIDEIHRLHASIEEYLYPAIEDFRLDIIIDQGPKARTIRIDLPPFTLVGATTRAGMLTAPMRSRFGIPNRPNRDGDGTETHRPAIKFLHQRLQHADVHVIEAVLVDVAHDQRLGRDFLGDLVRGLHQRIVAHPAQ